MVRAPAVLSGRRMMFQAGMRENMTFLGFGKEEYATQRAMGTSITHRVSGLHARRALRAVMAESERLEGLLSRFRPDSDIGKLNTAAGAAWVKLNIDTYDLLEDAARFFRKSRGSFDVTIGPLADLWDCMKMTEAPGEERIRQVLPLVNCGDLLLDAPSHSARLKRPGQGVDLGGIGKGYAADRFIWLFRQFGCRSACTNIGGNVALLGAKPDGALWIVGIRHPREKGRLLGAVKAQDCAVVTSGDYEKYFISAEGRLCHHILDPATGYPADSGLISVTAVAKSATAADALSTSVFVAGMERGIMLLEQYEGSEAVLVDKDLQVFVTRGLADRFTAALDVQFEVLR